MSIILQLIIFVFSVLLTFLIQITNTLTVFAVQEACSKLDSVHSTNGFKSAIVDTCRYNAAVDLNQFNPAWHCDAEEIREGQKIITDGIDSVKINIDEESYFFARINLGMALHTLQVQYMFIQYQYSIIFLFF